MGTVAIRTVTRIGHGPRHWRFSVRRTRDGMLTAAPPNGASHRTALVVGPLLVGDVPDVQFAVQQIGEEGFAGDRVIGDEVRGRHLAVRIDVVGDFVFGEHGGRRVAGCETGWAA